MISLFGHFGPLFPKKKMSNILTDDEKAARARAKEYADRVAFNDTEPKREWFAHHLFTHAQEELKRPEKAKEAAA